MDLFKGLQRMRELNFLHRDLKPANCLLSMDENTATVHLKIADLGASRECDDEMTPGRCTVWYSAPETLGAAYGFPSDVWSGGAVVAELLRGTPIFRTGTSTEEDHLHIIEERIGSCKEYEEKGLMRGLQMVGDVPGDLFGGTVVRSAENVPGVAVQLVARILLWWPEARLTATAALETLREPWQTSEETVETAASPHAASPHAASPHAASPHAAVDSAAGAVDAVAAAAAATVSKSPAI